MNKSELSSQISTSAREGKIILDYLISTGYIEQEHYFVKSKEFKVKLTNEQTQFLNELLKTYHLMG